MASAHSPSQLAQWQPLASFSDLADTIAASLPLVHDTVLDGEIVCLDQGGRSDFHKLLFRRDWPYFYAFDLLSIDGEDLRALPDDVELHVALSKDARQRQAERPSRSRRGDSVT